MKIITMSQEEFQWLRPKGDKKVAAIRIFNDAKEDPGVSRRLEPMFNEVLILGFEESKRNGKKNFNENHLEELKGFIERNIECEEIYIHCRMGKVRSVGVAKGLQECFPHWEIQHGKDGNESVYPDGHVMHMVSQMHFEEEIERYPMNVIWNTERTMGTVEKVYDEDELANVLLQAWSENSSVTSVSNGTEIIFNPNWSNEENASQLEKYGLSMRDEREKRRIYNVDTGDAYYFEWE